MACVLTPLPSPPVTYPYFLFNQALGAHKTVSKVPMPPSMPSCPAIRLAWLDLRSNPLLQPVIVNDRETQRSKGFGFLEFATGGRLGAAPCFATRHPHVTPSPPRRCICAALASLCGSSPHIPPPAVEEAKAAFAHLSTVTMQGRCVGSACHNCGSVSLFAGFHLWSSTSHSKGSICIHINSKPVTLIRPPSSERPPRS